MSRNTNAEVSMLLYFGSKVLPALIDEEILPATGCVLLFINHYLLLVLGLVESGEVARGNVVFHCRDETHLGIFKTYFGSLLN